MYSNDLFQKSIDKYQKLIDSGTSLGELSPSDDIYINLKNVSHVVERIWIDKKRIPRKKKKTLKKIGKYSELKKSNNVMASIKILNTPSGNEARNILYSGMSIGISSRIIGYDELNILSIDLMP